MLINLDVKKQKEDRTFYETFSKSYVQYVASENWFIVPKVQNMFVIF